MINNVLKGKIFLAIKNKRPEEESKGNVIDCLGEECYLVRFMQWDIS